MTGRDPKPEKPRRVPPVWDVRELANADLGYALATWREGHKATREMRAIPWPAYKIMYGTLFERLINDKGSLVLGAYSRDTDPELYGFLVATPGKRVDAVHWCNVKYLARDGASPRRHGVMLSLLRAAALGDEFLYTLRARRKAGHRTLDRKLASDIAGAGLGTAIYVPLMEWLR